MVIPSPDGVSITPCRGRNLRAIPPAEVARLAVPARRDSHQIRRRDDHQAPTLPTSPFLPCSGHPGACLPGEGILCSFFASAAAAGLPGLRRTATRDRRQPHARVWRFDTMRAGSAAPQGPLLTKKRNSEYTGFGLLCRPSGDVQEASAS